MAFSKKRMVRSAFFGTIAGLMMLLVLWNRAPALAQIQEEISFQYAQITWQSVDVRDDVGTNLGSGKFRVNVSNNRNDRTNGKAKLQLDEFTVELEITSVGAILYENDIPVGVVLSGRGTKFSEGQTVAFEVTHVVQQGPNGECCLVEILGEEVHASGGVRFEVEGKLEFRER
jgi:hypothetical protein